MLYLVFAVLVASNIAMGLALSMYPEIIRIFQKSDDPVLLAYETRILQLRMEVDRLNSRQYIQAGNLNLRLQELLKQQQVLSEQYQFIQVLAEKSEELGGPAIASVAAQSSDETAANANSITIGEPVVSGGVFQLSSLQISNNPQIDDAQTIANSLKRMSEQSGFIVSSIAQNADHSANKILNSLSPLGIAPSLMEFEGNGVGGPLLPLPANAESAILIEQVNKASYALNRLEQAKNSLALAPIYYPLPQKGRISSPFGPRNDPFGNTRAFHSGIDYPAPTGTSVTSVGAGKVLFAGVKGGYGKFVEIDHGNGIITRYAHMSEILVQTGQEISAGTPVGEVGSTGRSTGPHLHVEVRRDNVPVNPLDFFALEELLKDFS